MVRSSFRSVLIGGGAASMALVAAALSVAQPPHDDRDRHRDGQWPVYQRHAFDGRSRDRDRGHGGFGRFEPLNVPPVSAGWFQRPYPYHLDYYRMRYGGSYAPYFGNLYGPPQVAPYYGPYYGGYGGGYSNGYGQEGYGGMPGGYPGMPFSMVPDGSAEDSSPVDQPPAPKAEGLPAPAP